MLPKISIKFSNLWASVEQDIKYYLIPSKVKFSFLTKILAGSFIISLVRVIISLLIVAEKRQI